MRKINPHRAAKRPLDTLTRRSFICFTAGLGLSLAQFGCSSHDHTSTTPGYASDAEVKDYPVHLVLYADANIQWMSSTDASYPDRLSRYIGRYQKQTGREEVSIDVIYTDPAELLSRAQNGFGEGDAILARSSTLDIGNTSEVIEGGAGGYLIRDMSYNFPERCVIVRAAGSDATLPPAATLSGKDSPDGTINQLQQLPSFDGLIALSDPKTTTEGEIANAVLARQGFYSDENGGVYDERIASKLIMYPTEDDAMAALDSGLCQLGFALRSAISNRFTGIEQCYDPSGNTVAYSAAALVCSDEPGVARDFFAFIQQCTD